MLRNLLIIIVLLIIGVVATYIILKQPESTSIEFGDSLKSTFGEDSEYVNKQANFSVKYPNSWRLEIKTFDSEEDIRGVRIRGGEGYVDLQWSPEYEKGGCTEPFSELQLSDETIEVCNFKQDDDSEIWNQIVKEREELVFWSNAYAASPSAQTRQAILDLYSTLKFF